MNREEWKLRAHSVRELLHTVDNDEPFTRRVRYGFGFRFNPMFGFYHLWDGFDKKTVATVRVTPKTILTRYSPDWMFKDELLKMTSEDKKTIFASSENVSRHDDWVSRHIQRYCERAIQNHNTFLEKEKIQGGYRLVIHYPPELRVVAESVQGFGTVPSLAHTTGILEVIFRDEPEHFLEEDTHNKVYSLLERGVRLESPITYEKLLEIYAHQELVDHINRTREELTRQMQNSQTQMASDSMFSINRLAMRQIERERTVNPFRQEYVTTSSATAADEWNLVTEPDWRINVS